ncbi:hypothetical protein BN1723_010575 [Verticillium longisporum]|uniref:Uncharacterized protein n=1 Tax=Verticillium longisporum TaxID=100787 RepID=A0A0G4L0K0_VERLO|nr:hypothetical protein HYQ44_004559 [Verticillium longisporum]CRK15200.1 hypothetical protein BN1723_010575 [Verticillium longisporum]CRK19497.1 hypothetical protein BN1708_012654 [Verticillium longisporum]
MSWPDQRGVPPRLPEASSRKIARGCGMFTIDFPEKQASAHVMTLVASSEDDAGDQWGRDKQHQLAIMSHAIGFYAGTAQLRQLPFVEGIVRKDRELAWRLWNRPTMVCLDPSRREAIKRYQIGPRLTAPAMARVCSTS